MFAEHISYFSDFFLDFITLSDTAFHNLLGLLLVVAILRVFLPLHKMMKDDLPLRNEVADLAETDGCNEFDIFIKAIEYYGGWQNFNKVKQDFVVYLYNWPDNYILPYYVRLYLEMRKGVDLRSGQPMDDPDGITGKKFKPGVAESG